MIVKKISCTIAENVNIFKLLFLIIMKDKKAFMSNNVEFMQFTELFGVKKLCIVENMFLN